MARLPDPSTWLSASEQSRLATLRVESRRQHYLAGHWLVRELLAQDGGKTAALWSLLECKGQPPQVVGADEVLHLSISHSGDWIAAGLATTPIGIDIEQRPRPLDGSIETLLLNVDEVPGSLGADEMLMRWVVKEAWLKRRRESALPERLRQLQVHGAANDLAEVCVYTTAAYVFAVAAVMPSNTVAGTPSTLVVAGFNVGMVSN